MPHRARGPSSSTAATSSKEASSSGGSNCPSWFSSGLALRPDVYRRGPDLSHLRRGPMIRRLAVVLVLLVAAAGAREAAGGPVEILSIGYIAPAAATAAVRVAGNRAFEARAAADAGVLGARQGAAEMDYSARLVGRRVELLEAPAATPEEAVAQAGRLAGRGVAVLLGGFDATTAA